MKTATTISKSVEKVITQSVMLQIECLDLSLLSSEEKFHLDLFLLSYYSGGIALKDLARLTRDKIKGKELDCRAIPYPKIVSMPINDKARQIIDRYKDQSFGDYILPILGRKHQTVIQQEGCVNRLMAKGNVTFRKIESIIGCGPITWQGARLAVIARMVEDKLHWQDIYGFAGCVIHPVEEYYCNLPGAKEELLEKLNRSFGNCTANLC